MAKNWKKIVRSDFIIKNPAWEPDRPTAEAIICGNTVTLDLGSRVDISEDHVDAVKLCAREWEENIRLIADRASNYIKNFLPGKKVIPAHLKLRNLTVHFGGSMRAAEVVYCFRVGGSYKGFSDDQLMELDDFSIVEFTCPIEKGRVDWSELVENIVNI